MKKNPTSDEFSLLEKCMSDNKDTIQTSHTTYEFLLPQTFKC